VVCVDYNNREKLWQKLKDLKIWKRGRLPGWLPKKFTNFLSIAKGSSGEVRAQLFVTLDQNYISEDEFNLIYAKTTENGRVIAGLINYLKQSELRGSKFK